MDICICITDSLCYIPEANTTLQINYTPINIKKKDAWDKTEHFRTMQEYRWGLAK